MNRENIEILMTDFCNKCQQKENSCGEKTEYCEMYQAKYLSLMNDGKTAFNEPLIGEIISICHAYSDYGSKLRDITELLRRHDYIMLAAGGGCTLILCAMVKLIVMLVLKLA